MTPEQLMQQQMNMMNASKAPSTASNNLGMSQQVIELQQALDRINKVSRDHNATLADKDANKLIAAAWPAIDQALMTMQREMARFPQNEEDAKNLNILHVLFSQIHNRFLNIVHKQAEDNNG